MFEAYTLSAAGKLLCIKLRRLIDLWKVSCSKLNGMLSALSRKTCWLVIWAVFGLVFSPAAQTRADEIPPEIQSSLAILKQDPASVSIQSLVFLGEPLFIAAISAGPKVREWTFDAAGVPLSVELFQEELPATVQDALAKLLASGSVLGGLARTFEGGSLVFEIDIETPKGLKSISYFADGKLSSREISESELPAPVLKALKRRLNGESLEKCYRSEENGTVYFTAGLARPKGPVWLTFDAAGAVAQREERVEWDAVPPAVQNALMGKLNTKERLRIIRKTEDREVSFEVWAFTPEKLDIYSVTSEGVLEKLR